MTGLFQDLCIGNYLSFWSFSSSRFLASKSFLAWPEGSLCHLQEGTANKHPDFFFLPGWCRAHCNPIMCCTDTYGQVSKAEIPEPLCPFHTTLIIQPHQFSEHFVSTPVWFCWPYKVGRECGRFEVSILGNHPGVGRLSTYFLNLLNLQNWAWNHTSKFS